MDTYMEQYQSEHGGVTLHTWTEREGRKEENFYITGVPGTPVALAVPGETLQEAPPRYP